MADLSSQGTYSWNACGMPLKDLYYIQQDMLIYGAVYKEIYGAKAANTAEDDKLDRCIYTTVSSLTS